MKELKVGRISFSEDEKTQSILNKVGKSIIRQVFSPNGDWTVLYHNNEKIWEGNNWSEESIKCVAEAIGTKYEMYEFTDEDEIDGSTPNRFDNIIGIRVL